MSADNQENNNMIDIDHENDDVKDEKDEKTRLCEEAANFEFRFFDGKYEEMSKMGYYFTPGKGDDTILLISRPDGRYYREKVPKTDDEVNIVHDEDGNPIMIDDSTEKVVMKESIQYTDIKKTDENGEPIVDENGDPLYEEKRDENGNIIKETIPDIDWVDEVQYQPIPELDENGEPKFSEGKPVYKKNEYVQKKDENGKPLNDIGGMPIYEEMRDSDGNIVTKRVPKVHKFRVSTEFIKFSPTINNFYSMMSNNEMNFKKNDKDKGILTMDISEVSGEILDLICKYFVFKKKYLKLEGKYQDEIPEFPYMTPDNALPLLVAANFFDC